MTFSKIGRMLTALVATAALGLGMTACGGGTLKLSRAAQIDRKISRTQAAAGFF